DEEEGRVKAKKSRDEDDDDLDEEEDEEDVEPEKKKKGKAGTNKMMIVLLLAGSAFLLLGVGGLAVAAFVWPRFMLRGPDNRKIAKNDGGQGNNNPPQGEKEKGKDKDKVDDNPVAEINLANYVVPDATVILGADSKALRESKKLDWAIEKLTSNSAQSG